MFVIFGSGYAALSGVIVLLNRHALARSEELSLNDYERFETGTEIRIWLINMAVALVSIVLALSVPGQLVGIAGMFYGAIGVFVPWLSARRRRARVSAAS